MTLEARIEAVLFAAARALSCRQLAAYCDVQEKEIEDALERLSEQLRLRESGLQLVTHEHEAELVTHPEAIDVVGKLFAAETQGELSRPSLEALSILAYRGPMTRPELEQIRGVQSSLILRHLMMRGLVEQQEDTRLGQSLYVVTGDFLKYLGVERVQDLPDFEHLHRHPTVEHLLEEGNG